MIRFPVDIVERPSGRSRGAVSGFVPNGLTVLYGEAGARKTTLALGLAIHVASGLPFGPFDTKAGLVIYIAAEDHSGVEDRIAVAVKHIGLGDDVRLGVMPLPRRADDQRFVADVVEAVRAATDNEPVVLVILDTLAASVDGATLNDDAVAGAVMANMLRIGRELDCSTLVIHHPGKGARGERGSQVIRDRADATIRVEARGETSVAVVEKMRNGRAGASFTFNFQIASRMIAGENVNALVLSGINSEVARPAEPKPSRRIGGDAAALLGILRNKGPGWINLETLRPAFYATLGDRSQDARKKAFQRAVAALVEAAEAEAGHGTLRDIAGTSYNMSPEQSGDGQGDMGQGQTHPFRGVVPSRPARPDTVGGIGAAPL
ncbi:AAA family ATPase [Roseiarcaceae bacterium H3SJ34-1]|uniref:AAA family ATPase n=1 Tax=Terripilifer ovatus TaxID=3032367 RepID=UPI003AB93977|nr:AAA family ATPase [Roseiarcaceae bacterium H3SJ34-1]